MLMRASKALAAVALRHGAGRLRRGQAMLGFAIVIFILFADELPSNRKPLREDLSTPWSWGT